MEHESIRSIFSQLGALPEGYKRALVEQLYDQARSSVMVLIGTTLVLVLVLNHFLSSWWVLLWGIPVLGIEIFRLYLSFRFAAGVGRNRKTKKWYTRFIVLSLLNASLFGLAILFLIPLSHQSADTTPVQAFIFIVILGLASGSVNSLAPDARISIAYLFLLMLPMPLYLFYHGGSVHIAIGILAIFFYILQVNTATSYNRILLKEYRQKSALTEAKKELHYLSLYDPLTALKNRRGIDEDIAQLFQKKTEGSFPILFYLDLNNFRFINNSFGHTVGDKILIKIAERLRHFLQETCHIYRIGGDEFLVMYVAENTDKLGAFHRANHYGEILHELFREPFDVDGIHIPMQCSIGIAVGDTRTDDMDRISHYADIAMYQAKRTKSNKPIFFNKALEKENLDLLQLRDDLVNRLRPEQIIMHYQPIVAIGNDRLSGAEALVRWQHPNGELIPPDRFIPLATELKLINKITWWIIDHVLQQLQTWQQRHSIPGYVSINISPGHLSEKNFLPTLLQKIEQNNLFPHNIRLEITEAALIENVEQTQKIIAQLKHKGILCMLDDFGTGYSSIAYLNRFELSTLKIDKLFIQNMHKNPKDLVLIKYIIELAHRLGYTIITEGIETQIQKETIKALGSTLYYQGYLFSRPLSATSFSKTFLSKNDTV